MHSTIWIDNNGYKHLSTMMDGENDPQNGIQADPPNLNMVDWSQLGIMDNPFELKRDIHNQLVEQGLFTWMDVQLRGGLVSVLKNNLKKHGFDINVSDLKRQVIVLYKLSEKVMED